MFLGMNPCHSIRFYFFCFILLSVFSQAQDITKARYGKYSVGFKSILEFDYSRPSRVNEKMGRAVQINIWYPAKESKGDKMTFVKYVHVSAQEDSIVERFYEEAAVESFLSGLKLRGSDISSWRTFLASKKPMLAVQNATYQNGTYPTVLLIHGSASNYSFMGEYLASHGMVAISAPYKGYFQNEFDVNTVGMETEIRDHEFALATVAKMMKVQTEKIGLVGISFGGQSAVGLASKNKAVKGVVSLDGGIGSPTGPRLLSQYPFFSMDKITAPILHLYDPAGGNLDWFEICYYTDRYLIGFDHMDHSFFAAFGVLDGVINNVAGPNKPKAGDNYQAILEYTRVFLNEVYSDNPSSAIKIMELDKQIEWIEPNIKSKSHKLRKWSPVPLDELLKILTSKGLEGLMTRYKKQKEITSMPIADISYRALVTNRFNAPDPVGMLQIVDLYESDFPTSAMPKYFKGRTLLMNNKPDLAKDYFKKCLELLDTDASISIVDKISYKSQCEQFLK